MKTKKRTSRRSTPQRIADSSTPRCRVARNPSSALLQGEEIVARYKTRIVMVAAVVLTRKEVVGPQIIESVSQTISWRDGAVSEDEIRGRAVEYALKEKPGFSIAMVTVTKIEIPV